MASIALQEKELGRSYKRWPDWIGYAALIWSLFYGAWHFYWLLGGSGYPFKREGLGMLSALITYLPAQTGGIVIIGLCLLGVLIGIGMQSRLADMFPRWAMLVYAWGFAAALILFVPDMSLIAAMAYAFLLKFAFNWQMLHQLICILGACLWAGAGIAYRRKSLHACMHCGRSNRGSLGTVKRWGRYAAVIAALAPIPYAITRFAWALDIPLGVDRGFIQEFSQLNPSAHVTEWVFGFLCVGGGLLTLGLIRPWGEVFPRWFPGIGGKNVPVLLAVIPALCVAVPVTAAGFVFAFAYVGVIAGLIPPDGMPQNTIHGTIGPMVFWVPWGVGLGAAAIAYYYRRRKPCRHCGRLEGGGSD